jgi:hypothetical protein
MCALRPAQSPSSRRYHVRVLRRGGRTLAAAMITLTGSLTNAEPLRADFEHADVSEQ